MKRKSHIITIAGAGSARVPALLGNLIEYKDRFPVRKIIMYDIDNERMGQMEAYDRLVLKSYYPEVGRQTGTLPSANRPSRGFC